VHEDKIKNTNLVISNAKNAMLRHRVYNAPTPPRHADASDSLILQTVMTMHGSNSRPSNALSLPILAHTSRMSCGAAFPHTGHLSECKCI